MTCTTCARQSLSGFRRPRCPFSYLTQHRDKKSLVSLPVEVIAIVSANLDSFQDFMNLSRTCRTLYVVVPSTVNPQRLLRLALASAQALKPFLSKYFLLLACAPALSSWARLSSGNISLLHDAFRGGITEVLRLCMNRGCHIGCGLTMDRIRALGAVRFSVIEPLVGLARYCLTEQPVKSIGTGLSKNFDAMELFFQIAIYAALFAPDFESFLSSTSSNTSPNNKEESERSNRLPAMAISLDARLDFVKYCMPDLVCYTGGQRDLQGVDFSGNVDPRRACSALGPYQGYTQYLIKGTRWLLARPVELANQRLIRRFLRSGIWKGPWKRLRIGLGIGKEFWVESEGRHPQEGRYAGVANEKWRQGFWEEVVFLEALSSMHSLETSMPAVFRGVRRPTDVKVRDSHEANEEWKQKMRARRQRLESLTAEDKERWEVRIGQRKTHRWPSLQGDLEVCTNLYAPN